MTDRAKWLDVLEQLARPILSRAAAGRLRAEMPVEGASENRADVAHLEAVGRLLCGISPWLGGDCSTCDQREQQMQGEFRTLARRALASIVDPSSPDALNFDRGHQPLVDAAFLAQALLRMPIDTLLPDDPTTRRRLADALRSTRIITPHFNNWLLFSATIEAGLHRLGETWDATRVEYALRQHEQWYVGDGAYSDGPEFHWDYYNSFVIHPMLIDVLSELGGEASDFGRQMFERVLTRATRFAQVLERMISPEGTFPPIGRSLAYRCGVMHGLAQAALREMLPQSVTPSQVRCALTAVMTRSLGAEQTFDDAGFLRIGFCGAQPDVAERYISTGSLYLASTIFLPLGLPPAHRFWADAPALWTQQLAWSGGALLRDHALKSC